MYKFKVFIGSINYTADDMANEWLEEHPNVEIINMKYQQARYGDHSICILYKENK